jgi:hypothetical protein
MSLRHLLIAKVIGAVALIGAGSPLGAAPVTWDLDDVMLVGGGTLTGDLVYDHDTQSLISWSVMSSPGAPLISPPDGFCPPSGCTWTSATTLVGSGVEFDTPTYSQFVLGTFEPPAGGSETLIIALAGQLTDAGGTVAMAPLNSEGCHAGFLGDPGCVLNGGGPGGADIIPGALTTVSVPAPPIGHGLPGLLMVGGLLLGAKLLERRKSRRFQFG